jgi:hypothetical protein
MYINYPVLRSHIIAVLSKDPVTNFLLSLLIAIHVILFVWFFKVNNDYPVFKSQTIAVQSNEPVTTFLLSLLIAKL